MDSRIELAKLIIKQEAEAVGQVAERLGESFVTVVERMLALRGRVVTAGMGKAGIIAEKASATFASTGTPSIFLHPAEAVHGDLGRVMSGDLLLAFSKSGETEEVLRLLGPVKGEGVPVVAITQSPTSSLGRHSDHVLELGNIAEAGAFGLAPSASTTAMLALADALALVVMEGRRFGPDEFARFHPGGTLGRRLMKVNELMRRGDRNPTVKAGSSVLEAIRVMSQTAGRPGATTVVDDKGLLVGFFTDGDLRRLLESGRDSVRDILIDEVMTAAPKTIAPDTFALEALAYLHKHRVDSMPVVDHDGIALGLLDVQDLLDLKIG
ncbi:MAG: KpsF/GutQ family sugar-phosphate isomerase [Planctomycetes bacterium]|nr:KpsF/GutQ family sugar-phosphate isomerase [Planctomycetota bacterium]MCB9870247.1 KpsF/GutQ family sugar-phosphate isomerase [Planctomycetota bacterium]MCB9888172.1 KpsF/GutQ family sugar-phosphate isomerase [Planctomycetota bacterium]